MPARPIAPFRREAGFTLIELMIVVAIIAIVASLAIPNLMASTVAANENVTVSTLRTITSAQFRFKAMGLVDRDFTGSYEYGSFQELSGARDVRDVGDRLSPGLLSGSFGQIDADGRILRQGYLFAIYLPGPGGVGLAATDTNLPSVDPMLAEIAYTVLAWPSSFGHTGRATFFVNEQGEILRARSANYSGTDNVPPPGAGLVGVPSGVIVGGRLATGTVGSDGQVWTAVR